MSKLFEKPLEFIAFLQASGVMLYIVCIAWFLQNGEAWFGTMNRFAGPIAMLTLFIISAVITATMFLGRSAYLFWEKKYQSAFRLVGYTVVWMIGYLVLTLIILSA